MVTKDKALKRAKICIQTSLEYKRGNATAVEAVEDIDAVLAQPEPPAQPIIQNYLEKDNSQLVGIKWSDYEPDGRRVPLAAQLAQRPWVGLTEAEAQWLYDNCRTPSNLMEMVEAKLKELNT